MNSHEYARKIKEAAEYILTRPEFETSISRPWLYLGHYWSSGKDSFLAMAKSLGSLTKEYTKDELKVISVHGASIEASVDRNTVCRLVKEAQYECDPLLSSEEEKSIGV